MTPGERVKRLRAWLDDLWFSHGWILCSECWAPFRRHDFWNPTGPKRDRLTCSLECCATASGKWASDLLAELP